MENKDSLKKINESEDSTSINVSDKDLIDGQRLIIQFENSEESTRSEAGLLCSGQTSALVVLRRLGPWE
jgi:hypothetical protein